MKKLTPAQAQYMELKWQHNDCLLFFRMWDFYEVFYEDAEIAHKVLGITLTARNKSSENPIPMAWIPHHALEKYLPGLVDAGHKVAIAEQVGKVTKGKVVDRQVTQIITPGTKQIDTPEARYVCALAQGSWTGFLLSWWDLSLGTYYTSTSKNIETTLELLEHIWIAELVLDSECASNKDLQKYLEHANIVVSLEAVPYDAEQFLMTQLWVSSLAWYGKALDDGKSRVVALLFSYLSETQKRILGTIHSLQHFWKKDIVHLDDITIKNLEIFLSSYEWSVKQSLYGVMNTCSTPMGSRLLYQYLKQPLQDLEALNIRQSRISWYLEHQDIWSVLQASLKKLPDVPRLLTSLMYKNPSALKVQNLKNILEVLQDNTLLQEEILKRSWCSEEYLEKTNELGIYLQRMMIDEQIQEQKNYIRAWVSEELDEVRKLAYQSDELLMQYQQELVSISWVQKIKIAFVRNQWYFIEVTPKDIEQFEKIISSENEKLDFVRAQSLKWWQRYMSTYLSTLQNNILEAKNALSVLESELLREIVIKIESYAEYVFGVSAALGILDLCSSHADMAKKDAWTLPEIHQGNGIRIQWGFHPVVKHFLDTKEQYIPNSYVSTEWDFFHLITWPNMWWKSTYLRQNALVVLLAHCGLCVPAVQARISLVDGIFARVWSWDALAKNQSTFMTEMVEMANILHNATSDSFIVLDELGRGTSTYDWLALAKAITVYVCQKLKTTTLFASHYHELTTLEWVLSWFSNWNVWVFEWDKDLVFTKKIERGGVSKSYGIDVAKLAGIPQTVLDLSTQYLTDLETNIPNTSQISSFPIQVPLDFSQEIPSKNIEEQVQKIKSIDLMNTSPLDLMKRIEEIQSELDS